MDGMEGGKWEGKVPPDFFCATSRELSMWFKAGAASIGPSGLEAGFDILGFGFGCWWSGVCLGFVEGDAGTAVHLLHVEQLLEHMSSSVMMSGRECTF